MDELQIRTAKILSERGHQVVTRFRPSIDHQYEGDAIEIVDLSTMKPWPYELHHTPEDGDGIPHESYLTAWATPDAPGADPMVGELIAGGSLIECIEAILDHREKLQT